MAISIPGAIHLNGLANNRVEQKQHGHASYSQHENETETSQIAMENRDEHDSFTDTMRLFLQTPASWDNKKPILTGIAEMNTAHLQLFLAMQRQLVYTRLNNIHHKAINDYKES